MQMNNFASGAPGSRQFITNAGLITSSGPYGPNIMTAAWVHQISYDPPLIMVNIEPEDATLKNILATKEFGVSLASDVQNVLSSISGKYSGKEMDKISLLKKLGFKFYKGKRINAPMVKDASLNAELKLIKHDTMGDHIIVIGEVIDSIVNEMIKPISYHNGKYWKIGENIPKPGSEALDKITLLADKYKKVINRTHEATFDSHTSL